MIQGGRIKEFVTGEEHNKELYKDWKSSDYKFPRNKTIVKCILCKNSEENRKFTGMWQNKSINKTDISEVEYHYMAISKMMGMPLYSIEYPSYMSKDGEPQKQVKSTSCYICEGERIREYVVYILSHKLNESLSNMHMGHSERYHLVMGLCSGYPLQDIVAYLNGSSISSTEVLSTGLADFYVNRRVSKDTSAQTLRKEAERKHNRVEDWDKELAEEIEEEIF